jgi:hypothetical protein
MFSSTWDARGNKKMSRRCARLKQKGWCEREGSGRPFLIGIDDGRRLYCGAPAINSDGLAASQTGDGEGRGRGGFGD